MSAIGIGAVLGGCILIAVVLQDAFEVVLLNRPVRRRIRLTWFFFKAAWVVWSTVGALFEAGPRREAVLGIFGPGAMVMLFGLWAVCIIIGFGLLQWGLLLLFWTGPEPLSAIIIGSGDAFFTLNYSDVFPNVMLTHSLVLIEAGTGFGFIALTISYLPVLDQHFTHRDAKLITMGARAGSPPTSVSLLLWHSQQGDLGDLNEWLRSWELWSAGLIESHSSYPMLSFYRSQHSNQSWLASLAVILDCCAILLATFDEEVIYQAECTFMAALRVLVEINQALALRKVRGCAARTMTPEIYGRIREAVTKAGYNWTDSGLTMASIFKLNAVYEPLLSQIACYLLLALPDWLPPAGENIVAGREAVIARLTGDKTQVAERS